MSTLYLVATPIGNLEDITHRALRVLAEASLIAAEDTRQTRKLLSHYEIKPSQPLVSYHEHSKAKQIERIMTALDVGDVALVSDAGTPGINDPGFELVRAALESGHQVSPIPGPSAPMAALTASGLPGDSFLYLGYLPRKSAQRQRAIEEAASLPFTLIFLETPHRLLAALDDLAAVLGDREIAVAREMTKLHEEFFRGSISEAIAHFSAKAPRGEITLIVAGASAEGDEWSSSRLREEVQLALTEGEKPSQIARRLTRESGWARRDIYNLVTELQNQTELDEGNLA
ncbi:MAG: 16S rRNA (cytidine(1402)-2'-O)-methyltransferase [Anaerolineales bacterium]|nr:16S rRNA (cytidine(1402)-2'-O)-methyltransferase [Chloroflexota bacterium]MBL7162003.1 16S rRNA (cytidine(1402)-2'-O)-methyltransferase [Anaerolineales bacterium]